MKRALQFQNILSGFQKFARNPDFLKRGVAPPPLRRNFDKRTVHADFVFSPFLQSQRKLHRNRTHLKAVTQAQLCGMRVFLKILPLPRLHHLRSALQQTESASKF